MHRNPFSDAELAHRVAATRDRLAKQSIDIAVFSVPESVFYLTGLDHWAYFAPHYLVLPREGEMTLITRAVERVTIETQVRNARFLGHSDSETAAARLVALLQDEIRFRGASVASRPSVGLEEQGAGLSAAARLLRDSLPEAVFGDISGMSDALRLVKSEEEMALLRQAARASDAAAGAAIAALGDGVPEAAAEALAAMTRGRQPARLRAVHPPRRTAGRRAHDLGPRHLPQRRARVPGTGGLRVALPCAAGPAGASGHDQGRGRAHGRNLPGRVRRRLPRHPARGARGLCRLARGGGRRRLRAIPRPPFGYLVGIGFPPSWTGGNSVTGLRHDSDLRIEAGMSFHILSWLMGAGKGDYFVSNTVLLERERVEVLTRTPVGPIVV